MELEDGTFIPNFLSVRSNDSNVGGYSNSVNDITLRAGTVIAAYNPSDSLNRNKKYIEYDVEVRHANGSSGYTTITYPRAQVISLFGGVADYSRWVPRISTKDSKNQINLSSKVLLLCVNGNTRSAYIICGLPNPNVTKTENLFNQHVYEWEYNGVYQTINLDGEFSIFRKGATNPKGELLNAQKNASGLFFTKDGAITLGFYDIKNNTIDKFNEKAPNVVLNQNTNHISLKSTAGVLIGDATDYTLMGSTYRKAQAKLNNSFITKLAQIHDALMSASNNLIIASAKHTIPTTGASQGAPYVNAAGMDIQKAANLIQDLSGEVQSFENDSGPYLSKKNLSD